MRIFCDSNILFSASYSHPKETISGLIFELSRMGKFEIVISELVKNESTNNIQIKKRENLQILESLIAHTAIIKDQIPNADFLPTMPTNDRIILFSALDNKVDFFITGNTRDFKELFHTKIENTIILNPRDFVDKNWEYL